MRLRSSGNSGARILHAQGRLERPASSRSRAAPTRIAFDGGHHSDMSEAAAQDAGHRLLDLLFCSPGILVEKGFGGHYDATHAESTLRRLFVDECLLNRVRLLDRSQTFERRNPGAGDGLDGSDTGA